MTKKDAEKIANNILHSDFAVYGYGNFDLSHSDLVDLLLLADSSLQETAELYNKLYEEKM